MIGFMRVEFRTRPGGGTFATVDRSDGVQVLVTSYDRVGPVPHDLAHFVTERALRVERGFWGSVAAGAEFASVSPVSGRRRHDAGARSDAIRKANAVDLGLAELLVGAVLQGMRTGDAAGEVARAWKRNRTEPSPFPPERCVAAADELRRLSAELASAGSVVLDWPDTGRGGGRPDAGRNARRGGGRRRSR